MTSPHINLHSAWYCPFAQRTWIALEYLGIPYSYEETDPYNKTEAWMETSRGTGQVPVLGVTDNEGVLTRIPDSLRTLEYLEDINTGDKSLYPADPAQRADARFWLGHQGQHIIPALYRFLKAQPGSAVADLERNNLMKGIETLAEAMSPAGPYFFGDTPGIVDIALVPFIYRIELLLSHFKDFHLPTTGKNWSRFAIWWKAIKSHKSVLATMPDPDTYTERLRDFYIPYSLGGGQEDVTKAA
jgi:glutathione S-transferase